MTPPPFRRRTLVLLAILGGVSLLAGFGALIFGSGAPSVASSGTDTFSASAIGHGALFELLQRSGRPVLRSRGRSAEKAGDEALLLVLEPPEDEASLERLAEMVGAVTHCLVVLPKWRGEEDPAHPGWLAAADLKPAQDVARVLTALNLEAAVERPGEPLGPWTSPFAATPDVARPQLVRWNAHAAPAAVEVGGHAWLVQLDTDDDTNLWLLSDPDVLSNHGLSHGDNAAWILAALDHIAPGRTIILDEALHGFGVAPNLWGELGRFPLVLMLAQALLTIGALLWAGMPRFGSPEPEVGGLAAGKAVLIDNTAELLLLGGHTSSLLLRYFRLAEQRVAAAYHLPADLEHADRRRRLKAIAAVRGLDEAHDDAYRAVVAAGETGAGIEHRSLRASRQVRDWMEEMLDGNR